MTRSYHFASPSYVSSFGEYPPVDVKTLRSDTVKYLENFDSKTWFDDPVCSLIRGQTIGAGESCDTIDAFGKINGKQILADSKTVDKLLEHVKNLDVGKDFRAEVRRIEARLLSQHASFLIGNQAMDFHKQDGVTEIEESIEANVVERKLNDLLLKDESAGRVRIQRHTALVGCVSNFSNFLDLCRKTLRNIELGIPVLVLSRSNTTQHMYRWVQLLLAGALRGKELQTIFHQFNQKAWRKTTWKHCKKVQQVENPRKTYQLKIHNWGRDEERGSWFVLSQLRLLQHWRAAQDHVDDEGKSSLPHW